MSKRDHSASSEDGKILTNRIVAMLIAFAIGGFFIQAPFHTAMWAKTTAFMWMQVATFCSPILLGLLFLIVGAMIAFEKD